MWQQLILFVMFLLMGVFVNALTKKLRFNYQEYLFPNPKMSAIWGITSVVIGWILVSAIFLLVTRTQTGHLSPSDGNEYNLNRVVSQFVIALIQIGPVLVVMRWRKELWASARVTSKNFWGAILVGIFLSIFSIIVVLFVGNSDFSGNYSRLSIQQFWAFINYAIVGFCEEFVFRGFLQTRMIAWVGRWQGWIGTSVLMALAHIIQRITMMGLPIMEALISSIMLLPISLLMGYVMLRTENIIAPSLFHTFANWVNTLQ